MEILLLAVALFAAIIWFLWPQVVSIFRLLSDISSDLQK
jgi:hypothetical protein